MPINRDLVDPDELTSQVRTALADLEINGPNSLADLLPSEMLDDIEYEAEEGQGGLITAADYRAYDGTLTIGRDEALGRMRGRIHSLGQTIPLMEEDRLRMRNDADQALRSAIERMAKRAARAVGVQVNLKRAEALATGKLFFRGNGQNFDVDFGRKPEFTTTAADLFTDEDVDPIGTLEGLFEAWEDENGYLPEQMIASSKVKRAFYRHPKITNMAWGRSDSGGRYAPEAAVDALLSQYDLPPFTVRGGKVKVRNLDGSESVRNLLPDDSIILLPGSGNAAEAGSSDLGFTAWGTTLEAQKSDWGIAPGEEAGIVAAVFDNEKPPARMEVYALAIAMPVLVNPNLSLCAKVI